MIIRNYTRLNSASELPGEWDEYADDCFQRRGFLLHLEKYNKCGQRYYIMRDENGVFLSGAIIYTITQDLLTFLMIKSPLKMNFIGVPCSVSSRGIIGAEIYYSEMAGHILRQEKGMTVGLNLPGILPGLDCASGKTLPVIVFHNRFSSFGEYLNGLRSDYKRRYNKITGLFEGINEKTTGCKEFTREMYKRYLDVLKRSKGRLETLTYDFFVNLHEPYELRSYYTGEKLIGWFITVKDSKKLFFFLGGIDYSLNTKYATYFNMLFRIVKAGIEDGCEIIDLGQTAEIPKMRTGGELSERFMFGYHSIGFLNSLLKAGRNMLVYGASLPETHVFRSAE